LEFFDTFNARNAHRLRDFHSIGAPGGNHFLSRAQKIARYILCGELFGGVK
jgi:hypothetical protein